MSRPDAEQTIRWMATVVAPGCAAALAVLFGVPVWAVLVVVLVVTAVAAVRLWAAHVEREAGLRRHAERGGGGWQPPAEHREI